MKIEDSVVILFPINNVSFNTLDVGKTNAHIIVYNKDCFKNITEYHTHLFLDGVFIPDDCVKRPILDKELSDVPMMN